MIYIFAVSYFGSKDIKKYLSSLVAQSYDKWKFIVVDNSESDEELGRLTQVTKIDPRAQVLQAPRNLGYFGAAEWATSHENLDSFSWLIVSNTDIQLASPDALRDLIAADAPSIGVVAPSIESQRDHRDQNPHLATRPSIAFMRRRRVLLGHPVTAQIIVLYSAMRSYLQVRKPKDAICPTEAQEIYAAHGSFMAFSREFFVRGGNLRHPIFLFAEEVYVAEQCLALDLKTLYVPAIRVWHVEHGQMGHFRSRAMLKYMKQASHLAMQLIRDGEQSASFERRGIGEKS